MDQTEYSNIGLLPLLGIRSSSCKRLSSPRLKRRSKVGRAGALRSLRARCGHRWTLAYRVLEGFQPRGWRDLRPTQWRGGLQILVEKKTSGCLWTPALKTSRYRRAVNSRKAVRRSGFAVASSKPLSKKGAASRKSELLRTQHTRHIKDAISGTMSWDVASLLFSGRGESIRRPVGSATPSGRLLRRRRRTFASRRRRG